MPTIAGGSSSWWVGNGVRTHFETDDTKDKSMYFFKRPGHLVQNHCSHTCLSFMPGCRGFDLVLLSQTLTLKVILLNVKKKSFNMNQLRACVRLILWLLLKKISVLLLALFSTQDSCLLWPMWPRSIPYMNIHKGGFGNPPWEKK